MRQGFNISINDYNREVFTTFKVILEQKEEESATHVTLKVLAAAIHYEPGILIEPAGDDPQYRPDLLIRAVDGSPGLWIECGAVKTAKLDKLTSRYGQARFVVVKRYEREIRDLRERAEKEVRRLDNLSYLAFEPDFVERAAAHVAGQNDCISILSDDHFQFIINGHESATRLFHARHDPPGWSGKKSY